MGRKKSEKEREGNRKYQKGYYADNKDTLADAKAKRYQDDPEYRERMKTAAKRSYWFNRRPASNSDQAPTLPDVQLAAIEPKGIVTVVIDNVEDARHGEAVHVEVHTTAAVEMLLGRNSQTIRVWLKEGILPEPALRGRMVPEKVAKGRNPRLFTQAEMEVIDACRVNLTLPSHGKKHDIFTRCVTEGFAKLRQGIEPQAREAFFVEPDA